MFCSLMHMKMYSALIQLLQAIHHALHHALQEKQWENRKSFGLTRLQRKYFCSLVERASPDKKSEQRPTARQSPPNKIIK